jgi:multicomponent Na+:H+ antiporter subunit G
MVEAVTAVLMCVGAFFVFLGALGLVRLPDIFTRMQAATKATVLGAACTLLAAAVFFENPGVIARVLATIAFICLTAPVAAHMVARAAHFVGAPMWEGTIMDELRDRYDPETHELRGVPSLAAAEGEQPND